MVSRDRLSYVGFWFDGIRDKKDLRRVFTTLREIGYSGMDLKDTCFSVPPEELPDMLKTAAAVAKEEGMVIPCAIRLRDHCDPSLWEKNAEDTCSFIRMCAEAGIPLVNTSVGNAPPRTQREWYTPPRRNDTAGWDALLRSMERIIRVAEECRTPLVLEPVQGQLVHDFFTARELFRRVGSPWLCLTMDPSHDQVYDNDIPWCIRQWGSGILRHVHLKDAAGLRPAGEGSSYHITPLLGEGQVDWPGFFTALDAIGYRGWYSVEFESWLLAERITPKDAAAISFRGALSIIDEYRKGR